MKKWNTPDVTELNINETANGMFDVNWEGPYDFILGDHDKCDDQKPSTPDTPDTDVRS